MKPPITESKYVEPNKLVTVLAEPLKSKCILKDKYSTMLTMFATNPILSKATKPTNSNQIKYGGTCIFGKKVIAFTKYFTYHR